MALTFMLSCVFSVHITNIYYLFDRKGEFMDAEEWIKETTKLLGCMPIAVQKKFALHWSITIMENNENLNEVIEEMVKNTDRYVKLKRWMDKRFSKNFKLTPTRVAQEAVKYFKINSKMMPFLIKTAQSLKNRVRQRIAYSNKKIATLPKN